MKISCVSSSPKGQIAPTFCKVKSLIVRWNPWVETTWSRLSSLRKNTTAEITLGIHRSHGHSPFPWEFTVPMGIHRSHGNSPFPWEFTVLMGIHRSHGNSPFPISCSLKTRGQAKMNKAEPFELCLPISW